MMVVVSGISSSLMFHLDRYFLNESAKCQLLGGVRKLRLMTVSFLQVQRRTAVSKLKRSIRNLHIFWSCRTFQTEASKRLQNKLKNRIRVCCDVHYRAQYLHMNVPVLTGFLLHNKQLESLISRTKPRMWAKETCIVLESGNHDNGLLTTNA